MTSPSRLARVLHEQAQTVPTVAVAVAPRSVDGADEGCAEPSSVAVCLMTLRRASRVTVQLLLSRAPYR